MIPAPDGSVSADLRRDAARRVLAASEGLREDLDRLATLGAALLDAPVAIVTVIADAQHIVGAHGLPTAEPRRVYDLDESLCALVQARGEPVVVAEAGRLDGDDPRCRLLGSGYTAYLGVPLLDAAGIGVGTVSVLDDRPRTWTQDHRAMLHTLASSVLTEVTLRDHAERHDRLLAAFESAPVAVAVVRGLDRAVEYANPAFLGLFPAARPGADGTAPPVAALDVPAVDARVAEVVDTGRSVREEDQHVGPPAGPGGDGEPGTDEQVTTLSFSPIAPAAGGPPDVLIVGVDVTAQTRARHSVQRLADEQQVLASATAAMQDAVEPVAELRALARSVVPAFADACSAVLLDPPVAPGTVVPALTGSRVAFASERTDLEPPAERSGLSWGSGAHPLHDAVRTGRPASWAFTPDSPAWEDTGGSAAWVRAAEISSIASAPVRVDGLVIGILTFCTGPDRPVFTRADLGVMDRIAARAGAAVSQGLTYQRQRDTSLALQRSMLTDAPIVRGLEVVSRYRPTAVDAEVGGDWYDAFALPDGDLAVAIGDVAGHDLAAAATMGQLRSMLRALTYDRDAVPGEILGRLDTVASGLEVTDFTTVVLGRLRAAGTGDPSLLHWSNAGHPPPLLVRADGRAELLEDGAGMVLGVMPERARHTATTSVPPGAALLLYTDGLVERRGRYPDANVVTLVEEAASTSDGTLDGLCDELVSRAPVDDDVALLAVRLDG